MMVPLGVRLALGHHPVCDRFHSDVYRIGPVSLCRGCTLTWPLFLLTFPLFGIWMIRTGQPAWPWFAAGLALGAPQVASVLWRAPDAVRAATKLLGGLGLGIVMAAGVFLPVPGLAKIGLLVGAVLAFASLLALRMRSILATCDACVWARDWGHCPGFSASEGPKDTQNRTTVK